ncbi:unnamed protein product [Paramecium octaurelia]|uniref:Uncharacterized protein n=1 Tax=Paramecium octaurelia TaxID=43137 RepID=A0A8S1T2A6_PAROT|nr:unnamed protein product [Paramecium octaurelia]
MSVPIENNNLVTFDCGIKQKVRIVNTNTKNNHTQNEMNIVFKSDQSSLINAFLGIQSLDIQIAKCSIGCKICFGAEPTMCITCIKKWGFYKNQSPPIESGYVKIVQFQDQNINISAAFEISIDEVNQNIIDEGQQKLIVSSYISTLTFQILVRCQENQQIENYFRNCSQCKADQFQFLNNTSNKNNALIYNALFMQVVASEKELIIRVSQTKLEIVELSLVDQVEQEVLIMKIKILQG